MLQRQIQLKCGCNTEDFPQDFYLEPPEGDQPDVWYHHDEFSDKTEIVTLDKKGEAKLVLTLKHCLYCGKDIDPKDC